MNNPNLPPPAPVRKGRGCMFYGCMTLLVLLLFAGVLAGVAVYYVKSGIETYTDNAPTPMPKVDMSDDEFEKLSKRVAAFDDALEKGGEAGTLVLSERDLNAIIQKSGKTKDLADHLYVTLHGDEVSGQVSIPLTQLNWLKEGRYLNGQATFQISLESGVLSVMARDIKVRGSSLPETFMSALRGQNLAPDATKDPKMADAIRKLESIQVTDSKVIVKGKPAP